MTQHIKITRTSVKIYKVADQDQGFYEDADVVNVHMAALADRDELENESLDWDDIDGALEDDTEYVVVLIDDEGNETPVDESNTTRDEELFPDDEEDDEEDEEEEKDTINIFSRAPNLGPVQ